MHSRQCHFGCGRMLSRPIHFLDISSSQKAQTTTHLKPNLMRVTLFNCHFKAKSQDVCQNITTLQCNLQPFPSPAAHCVTVPRVEERRCDLLHNAHASQVLQGGKGSNRLRALGSEGQQQLGQIESLALKYELRLDFNPCACLSSCTRVRRVSVANLPLPLSTLSISLLGGCGGPEPLTLRHMSKHGQ